MTPGSPISWHGAGRLVSEALISSSYQWIGAVAAGGGRRSRGSRSQILFKTLKLVWLMPGIPASVLHPPLVGAQTKPPEATLPIG